MDMSPDKNNNWPNHKQKLLLQIAFGDHQIAEKKFAEWNEKYGLADLDESTRTILPMVIQNLPRLKHLKFNDDLLKRYQRYYQHVWFDNSVKLKQAFTVINLFNEHGIKTCLLKGAAMLLYYYKNMGMRPTTSDIDLLISKKDIPKAIQLLRTLNFYPLAFFEWSGTRFEKSILNTMDGMDYAHAITYKKDKLEIDLHWKCLHIANQDASFETIYPDMVETTIFNNRTFVFSPEFQVFHTCIHGMMQMSNYKKFTWIMDILYILTQYQHQFNWHTLQRIAQNHQSIDFVRDLLAYLEQINPALVTPEIWKLFTNKSDNIFASRNMIHRIRTSSYRLIRKPIFYLSIYLSTNKNKSTLTKIKYFPNFVRKYFGIQKSLFTFMLKKILKNTERPVS